VLEVAARPASDAGAGSGSVRTAIGALGRRFRAAGFDTPELDARLLVLAACNLAKEDYILCADRGLSSDEAERIRSFEIRRLASEPVSRIIGIREFWGRDFLIGPAVLDPRPDTETLVETVLSVLRDEGRSNAPLRILDLGTGSGCILLTLLAELPSAWGVGADIDAGAIAIARQNALRLELDRRAMFMRGHWCEALAGPFDLVVSNPPYIRTLEIGTLDATVRCYDPMTALDGGADGLEAYRSIARNCDQSLAAQGWIAVEAGYGQANEIVRIFAEAGLSSAQNEPRIERDLAGMERVVAIKRQAAL
jgi:release factor glutamine methyltransferase